jgi:predicted RNA binding protein YcfA (HicA-like mRNA interferase family)
VFSGARSGTAVLDSFANSCRYFQWRLTQRVAQNRLNEGQDVIKRIESDGWKLTRTRGSHRQYRHPTKPGIVTVAGHLSADLARKTEGSKLKQAGIK